MKIQKISFIFVLALILLFAVTGSLYANLPTRYFDNIQANGYAVVDGQEDANQLRVQGYTTQTNNLMTLEQSDGDDKVTISNYGQASIAGERDAATGYDYWLNVTGGQTGLVDGAKSYGINVDMSRTAGYTQTGGDIDDAAIKARIGNYAANENYTTVVRGIDIQARNRSTGLQGTVSGGQISIQTDSGGTTSVAKALEVNTTVNGAVTDTLMVGDFRLFRQAATEPTQEYGVRIRNSSTTGTGGDAALWLDSDGSGETDDWGYGIDMSGADIDTADIRLQNEETIGNAINGTIALGGAVDVTGASLQYGPNNLYPLGVDTSGFEVVWGSEIITGATAITHGLTSPVWADCKMGQAPSGVAGESYDCYVLISGAVVTVTTVSSDTTVATTGATVYWEVKGTP